MRFSYSHIHVENIIMVFAIMVASSAADPTAPWEGHTIPTVPAVRKYAVSNVNN